MGNNKCKDPEVRLCFQCSRSGQEARGGGREVSKGRVVGRGSDR